MNLPNHLRIAENKSVSETFYKRDLSTWTSHEVLQLIFDGAKEDEPRSMDWWIAEEIITHKHFSQSLRDWAFTCID